MIETLPARQTRNYIKLVLTNLWIYKIRLNEKPDLLYKLASGSIPKYKFKNDINFFETRGPPCNS